jgi:hypothetical protein
MSVIPLNPYIAGAQIGASVMVEAVKALYNTAESISDFINEHIKVMQDSENPTISRTGRVLESAKLGFGLGYISPVIAISAGQLILGNPMTAITTIAQAATLTNPIAMTCAAVGAMYYGWSALTDQEKDEIIEKLSKGLDIGVEMIKSVIRFVIEKTKALWDSENMSEIKAYISNAAKLFGKTLGDITENITDKIKGALEKGVQFLDRNGDGEITIDDFKPWNGQNKTEQNMGQ